MTNRRRFPSLLYASGPGRGARSPSLTDVLRSAGVFGPLLRTPCHASDGRAAPGAQISSAQGVGARTRHGGGNGSGIPTSLKDRRQMPGFADSPD